MADDISSFLGVGPDAPEPSPQRTAIPASSDLAASLCRRYSDAYTEAHAVVTVGKTVKGVGIFLFIAIILAGFSIASQPGGEKVFNIAGILFACMVGIPIYVLGILVAAQGQTALATLDTAVNSSRHLKDDDVARVLSKRFSL